MGGSTINPFYVSVIHGELWAEYMWCLLNGRLQESQMTFIEFLDKTKDFRGLDGFASIEGMENIYVSQVLWKYNFQSIQKWMQDINAKSQARRYTATGPSSGTYDYDVVGNITIDREAMRLASELMTSYDLVRTQMAQVINEMEELTATGNLQPNLLPILKSFKRAYARKCVYKRSTRGFLVSRALNTIY